MMKLTYFNDGKGRNELIRLIFAIGKIQYQDNLISFKEYTKMRETNELPYGQLPTLEISSIDGSDHIFGQSCSLVRYAARISGLYPKDDELEILRTDGIIDSWRDTLDLYYETFFARKIIGGRLMMVPHPPSERYGKLSAFVNSELGEQFLRYERMLIKTGGQICNDKTVPFPSCADLAVFDLVKTMEGSLTDIQFHRIMKGKTALLALVEKIEYLDSMKFHLEKYPYKDLSFMFQPVSPFKRFIEAIMFPIVYFGIAIYTKIQRMFVRSSKKNE